MTSVLSPFLWICTTLANFSCEGKTPCWNDEFTMSKRIILNYGIFAFKALIFGSDVDLSCRKFIISIISTGLVGFKYILFWTGLARKIVWLRVSDY